MRNRCWLCVLSLALMLVASRQSPANEPRVQNEGNRVTHPAVGGMTVFLYVTDIDRAVQFYGTTLGLRSTVDKGPIRMFELNPSASIGLVDAKTARGGADRPSKDKPLTVSFVVDDIEGWYRYLVARGVAIARAPRDSSNLKVRFFLFTDPEGYELEAISWTQYGK